MISSPYNYIDPFSTVKSIMEFDRRRSNDCCFADIYEYFACNKDGEEYKSFSKSTKCRLWLIGNAEFVFDVYGKPIPCKTSEDEYADFWNKVYQKIKDDNNFYDRNKNYLHQLVLKNERISLIKGIKDGTINISEEPEKNVEKSLNVPTGIVDLDGEFFPCNFREHEFLAKNTCNEYHLDLNEHKSYLDILVKKGFVILRSMPFIGYYASFYSFHDITNKQFETINNIEKKFDIKFDFGLDEYKEMFKDE